MNLIQKKLKYSCLFLLLPLLINCKEKKSIAGFNEQVWKTDKMGCANKRAAISDFVLSTKDQWLGIDDDVIVDLLGRPERSYFYERNARSFAYYIQSGKQCNQQSALFGQRLIVEFNATGYSKRIYVEQD
ncbi:MAG: hypothetical protein EAZ07_08010 [Cytophagales bacterium]|nr:MAG: hypothetical protein EAZ07_08010 [Cytophagales bacterium]